MSSSSDIGDREALFNAIVEAVPAGVVHVALDGSIVDANAEALRILGYRSGEVTGRHIRSFETQTLHEDGTPCLPSEYPVVKAMTTGEPQGPETIGVTRPDGETYWSVFRAVPTRDAAGALTGAVVAFVDITARKRMEEDLRHRTAVWRSLAENLPDFVIIVDRDARIRSINRTLTEYDQERVIGSLGYSYIEEEHKKEWLGRFAHVLETGAPVTFQVRGMGSGGAHTWYESRFVPIAENGRVEQVLIVAHDITERRKMVARLAEKERLASIGMLSASVAHEIMNPLTSVLAHLDFAMSDRCPPGARQLKELRDAREGAARLQQIVRDLRTLGRNEAEEFFYVDVRCVVETALRLAGPQIAANIRVDVELGDLPDVLASESRLCQVMINLLLNAAQAIGTGRDGEREIRVRGRTGDVDGAVGVAVSDTGVGIAPEHLPRVFEPFFTTKETGTGLGLSIARAALERMGGRLEVESQPGKGATFTVWLPTTRTPSPVPR